MDIKLVFEKDLKNGFFFWIPIDSEADEFLSGLVLPVEENGNLYIKTNCMGAEGNMSHCLDIIHVAMDEIYKEKNGKRITEAR